MSLFSEIRSDISFEQRQTVEWFWGKDEFKSAERLLEIFKLAEELYQRGKKPLFSFYRSGLRDHKGKNKLKPDELTDHVKEDMPPKIKSTEVLLQGSLDEVIRKLDLELKISQTNTRAIEN